MYDAMFHLKTALVGAMLAVCFSSSSVQAHETLEPDGYDVRIWVVPPDGEGYWWTIERFDNEEDAYAYRAFLNFLLEIANSVNHRGETDPVTWQKFLDEIDLPRGWWFDLLIYVHPHYDSSRFIGLPMMNLRRL